MSNATIAPRRPIRLTRRRLLAGAVGGLAALVGGGAYATEVEPFWLDVHDNPIAIGNLPRSFEGFRIAHLSDLHASDIVPIAFLQRAIARVNAESPDAIVVTGDFVTHDLDRVDPVCDVLAALRAPVYACLGNHDYSDVDPHETGPAFIADALTARLAADGHQLLRNRAVAIERGGARLWIAGLEDMWSGHYDPAAALADTPADEPRIALVHNPDAFQTVDPLGPDLILCGHTHGGQVRIPFLGAPVLPIQHRQYDQGLFRLPHSQMYVSRGVGFLKQVRFDCRPEIPIHRLTRA